MKKLSLGVCLFVGAMLLVSGAGHAGNADVVDATLERRADGTFTVHATVRHGDEGWDHYANGFDVLAPDGVVLGTRVLAQPHVNEQPFTRSLRGLNVPAGVARVTVRAQDSVHGQGGASVVLEVPR